MIRVDEIMEKSSLLDGTCALPSSKKWSVITHAILIYNLITTERRTYKLKMVLFLWCEKEKQHVSIKLQQYVTRRVTAIVMARSSVYTYCISFGEGLSH